MDTFITQLFNGVAIGALLLLVALGLTFTFGQMNVINMAHGEFIMIGAYTPYVLQTYLFALTASLSFVIAFPLAFLVAGVLGVVLERTIIRRMYGRPLDTLLVTFGIALILQQAARDIFGASNVQVVAPPWLSGTVTIGGLTMPYTRLFIIALVIAIVAVIAVFLAKLPQGRRMRAVMQNRELAGVSGIHTDRVDQLTFFIGSGLAGVAGVAVSLLGAIGPMTGLGYLIDAFLVVIVGGLGSMRGAVVAAIGIGFLSSFLEYKWGTSIGKALVFAAIVVFLQFRPRGLVALRTRGLS